MFRSTASRGVPAARGLLKSARQVIRRQSPVFQWGLDECAQSAAGTAVTIKGWVLIQPNRFAWGEVPEVAASLDAHVEIVRPLDQLRPDVIAGFFSGAAADHPQLRCGFRFVVAPQVEPVKLSLRLDGRQWALAEVAATGVESERDLASKVLHGKAGWLFLRNDTNNSACQHDGTLRLTRKGLRSWRRYSRRLQQMGSRVGAPVALLLSPTKESVLPKYYPHAVGQQTLQEQLGAVIPDEMLVHPVTPLSAIGDESYLTADTHFSDRGAMVATVEVARTLRLPLADVVSLFANDRYRPEEIVGDLGRKLSPVQTSSTQVLESYDYRKVVVYDNGLPFFGRIVVTENRDALLKKTCLVFGSSSSYPMLKYSSRIFHRVVLAHTAANLDPQLISKLKPDYVVGQTNARFIVRVPKLNYCIPALIQKILSEQTEAGRQATLSNQVVANEHWLKQTGIGFYHQTVVEALEKRVRGAGES
ncbi:hypothetical protein Poly24_02900 [Rosistilla carotiformis]|uniref:AlgX/AlgJ SGNH hydrolase-like domain-containing protein n=1 Tax=Rosistilla carotiformis TaxID=2528017 RepID=A0A518JM32_9BACT|nr:hypothetical protein Poly24_02900 [Rosistilla carotiformis]